MDSSLSHFNQAAAYDKNENVCRQCGPTTRSYREQQGLPIPTV